MNSLRSLAPDGARFKAVAGDFDSESMGLPDQEVFTIGSFKFVMNHGHGIVPWGDLEALSTLQRKHGADVVISGHTHENSVSSNDSGPAGRPYSAAHSIDIKMSALQMNVHCADSSTGLAGA